MAPMKVYGWIVSPWMARVLVCLEEVGAEYEVVAMSRSGGDHRRPEHLARNPFGEIPVLEDGDLTLYQSRAIARYILRKYKPELLREGDLAESAMVDVWVDVEAHQLVPVLRPIVMHCIINPHIGCDREQGVVDENLGKLRALLEVYEARLSGSGGRAEHLVGDAVSLADLSHFGFMRYFMATEYASVVDAYPRVKAWWDELLARPSVQKVMAGMPPDFGFGSGNRP
ncbi:glutathione S-transferase 4-like [Phragmites australis]|uniref:glutathione S-transferase 4-like n=1 Tax=Phragmites australis TaxID=29695 RepID=UPI002D79E6E1|nr:glutathione S-transferase 4-like [Phragmites australis]